MKKITQLLPIALMALFSFGFVSCTDDDDYYYDDDYDSEYVDLTHMAQILRGHWTGKTAARFYNEQQQLVEEVYDTDIEFDQYDSNSLSGRGRQLDYIRGELVYDRVFSWRIDRGTGDIIMIYNGENGDNFQMVIDYDDLNLTDRSFSGVQRGNGETDEFAYNRYTYAKKVSFSMD